MPKLVLLMHDTSDRSHPFEMQLMNLQKSMALDHEHQKRQRQLQVLPKDRQL